MNKNLMAKWEKPLEFYSFPVGLRNKLLWNASLVAFLWGKWENSFVKNTENFWREKRFCWNGFIKELWAMHEF